MCGVQTYRSSETVMVEMMRPAWSPTDLLFYALVRENCSPDQLNDLLENEIDWPRFGQLCRQHRVENIVSQNLIRHKTLDIPEDVKSTLLLNAKSLTLRSLAQANEVRRVGTLFQKRNVDLILTKGEAVSHRYYDLAYTRQSKDIDLWIGQNDVDEAEAILLELGYQKTSSNLNIEQGKNSAIYYARNNSVFFHKGRKSQVELHWRLFQNRSLLHYDFHEEFANAETFRIGDDDIYAMRSPSQLVYLACHGAVHFWHRLKWLADIERMVTRMSDDELRQAQDLAKDQQVSEILETALLLSEIIFSDAPKNHKVRGTVSKPVLENVANLLNGIHQSQEAQLRGLSDLGKVSREFFDNFRIKPTLAFKLDYIKQFCISEPDIERFKLGKRWLPLYFIIGPVTRTWGTIGKNTDSPR